MKKSVLLFTIVAAFLFLQNASAKVRFTASAPETVSVGDQFRLSYTITSDNVSNFRAPAIKGFDVLIGPSRSEQSSTQIINGSVSSSSSITFTYILMANSAGTFTIPGASAVVGGSHLTSNSVRIKVVSGGHSASNSSSSGGSSSGGVRPSSSRGVSGNDLFVTGSISRSAVYEQEALVLTYRIYTREANLRFDNVVLPDFKGFHSQEVKLPPNAKWVETNFRGKNYYSTIYRQFVLFPQQSGRLKIGSARFDAVVSKVKQSADPFDAFFNGGSNIVNIKKVLTAPEMNISVIPLPSNKPADFSGGVGAFNMTSSVNSRNVKTNDAVTMHIVISGIGNMKLIANPTIHFPDNFEAYDPKVTENTQLTANGVTGNKTIDYLLIPRDPGKYTIPAATLTYFDSRSKSYRTLRTTPYEINVEKGAGNASQVIQNFTNKQDLKVLGEDIRYIKMDPLTLQPKGYSLFGSFLCWLWYIIPFIAFIVFLIVYHQKAIENANVAKVRNKKANKVATKRLKYAGKLLAENKKDAFYDEVLKALWGYIGDKMNIPVSQLSKDNIEENMRNHELGEGLIKDFISTLDECEFAHFAPNSGENAAMDKVYVSCMNVISKIENSIKH